MRTCEERVEELHRRMQVRRREQARRRFRLLCAGAGAAALAAVILLALGISLVPLQPQVGNPGGAAASIFAEQGALGYVVTALTAFLLGVLLTLFCLRMKKGMDEEDRDDRKP